MESFVSFFLPIPACPIEYNFLVIAIVTFGKIDFPMPACPISYIHYVFKMLRWDCFFDMCLTNWLLQLKSLKCFGIIVFPLLA